MQMNLATKKTIFKISSFFFLCLGFLLLVSPASAAKKRPSRGWKRTARSQSSGSTTSSSTRGVKTSVKFRPDRLGLLVNFGSFGNVVSVTYTLSYTSNGVSQGAMGVVKPESAGSQREILFGTCSSGVCRWHDNVRNARLVIDSKLSSGKIIRKPYRIKV
ncbi:hypothetical protein ACFLZP_02635 [Patescibacteria group bacterium]